MRAGKEEGLEQVYDDEGHVILYQDEYIVSQEQCICGSSVPRVHFPLTEGTLHLTNWRIVMLGKMETLVEVDTVSESIHRGMRLRPELERKVCPFLEVYLDEVTEYKKTLLGEVKLTVGQGTVDISNLSKQLRGELLKALDWYLKSRK